MTTRTAIDKTLACLVDQHGLPDVFIQVCHTFTISDLCLTVEPFPNDCAQSFIGYQQLQ